MSEKNIQLSRRFFEEVCNKRQRAVAEAPDEHIRQAHANAGCRDCAREEEGREDEPYGLVAEAAQHFVRRDCSRESQDR